MWPDRWLVKHILRQCIDGLLARSVIPSSRVDPQVAFTGSHFDGTKTSIRLQIRRRISESILTAQDLFDRVKSALQVGIFPRRQNETSGVTSESIQNWAALRVRLVDGIRVQGKNCRLGSKGGFLGRSQRRFTGCVVTIGDENDDGADSSVPPALVELMTGKN